MKSDLLILETMDEVRLFAEELSSSDDRLTNAEILSLHPNIRAYLLNKGFSSLPTSDVMDVQSFQAVMDQCETFETFIRGELKKQNIEDPPEYFVNAFWHFLRLIWRHLLWNIELLDRCLERKKYRRIYAFKYGRVVTHSPWTEDDQLYMGDIAGRLCEARGTEFFPLEPPPLPQRNLEAPCPDGRIEKLLNGISFHLCQISAAVLSKRKTLLVPSFKYNVNRICDDLSQRNGDLKTGIFYIGRKGTMEFLHTLAVLVHVLMGKKMHKASVGYPVDYAFPVMTFARYHGKSYDDSIERNYIDAVLKVIGSGEKAQMTFKGVELSDFLVQKVRDDLTPYMLDLRFQAHGLEKLLDTFRPDCILSQMSGELYAALGHMAMKMDIPSVLISHGSHVWQREKHAVRENDILARNILVGDYRYSAVQSPLAREIALNMMKDPERIVNIKPTLWGREIRRRPRGDGSLTIVHAGTLKLRHNRRFIYETSDEFMKGLEDLIDAVAPNPRLRLILKIRPDIYELSMDTMKALLPKAANVVIEAEKPFLDVLPEADLMVSFSSTTIEEALSNKVPVLLYGGQGRYAHIPVEPFSEKNTDISKAVTFIKEREHLKTYMSKLNEKASLFHVPDEAFGDYRFSDHEVVNLTEWITGLCEAKK